MAFTPTSGYSENRVSTVFTDGQNNQRADFTRELDSDWIIEKYSAEQSSLIFTNGENKQRATVVYNIGNSGGGSGSGDVTSVNGKTGAVVLSGIDINSTVGDKTDTITAHLQNLTNADTTLQTNISIVEESLDQIENECVKITGNQTIEDIKTFQQGSDTALVKVQNSTTALGETPIAEKTSQVRFDDKNGDWIGLVSGKVETDGSTSVELCVRAPDKSGSGFISVDSDASGNISFNASDGVKDSIKSWVSSSVISYAGILREWED